jgi:RES domain-containing protein
MLPEEELRATLPGLPHITLHGPWTRVVGFHLLLGPPPGAPTGTRSQPLWAGGPSIDGARFTPRGGARTLYLASDAHTALLEVQAVVQIAPGPAFTLRTQPWTLISVDGVLTDVLDLTEPAIQVALGTTLAELTGEWQISQLRGQVAPTQRLGQAAYETGAFIGLRYTSAKNPREGTGLAVFADRLTPDRPSYLEVVDPHGRLYQRLP